MKPLLIGSRILLPSPFWLEVFSALTAIAWSLTSFWLDGEITNHEAYVVTMKILSFGRWEEVGIALATLRLLTLLSQKHERTRIVVTLLMSGFWCSLAYTIHLAPYSVLAIVFYVSLGVADAFSMIFIVFRREAHV